MQSREYLIVTKRERTGIITLVVLLLVTIFGPRLFCHQPKPVAEINLPPQPEPPVEKEEYHWVYDSARHYSYKKKNYNGGTYKPYRAEFTRYRKKSFQRKIIDINTADTTAFIELPGIGSKLASRIVLFREKLGGFYSVMQIAEVYGLKDSVFQKIQPYLKCDASSIRKLAVNLAGKDELKQHPYIRWKIAEALVAYREQHGSFGSLNDLARINIVDSIVLNKMIPYLSLN